jgi:hypothetical protein
LPADPVRLRVAGSHVLIRTWESEADFNDKLKVAGGVFVDTTEYRDDRFVTMESDRFDAGAPGFVFGFSDWGRPSFTTFAAHPGRPLLACGTNNVVIRIDVKSGDYRTVRLAGYFRQFITVSPTRLVVDAEAGVYGLSWDLDDIWQVGTDLIQSAAMTGTTVVLKTDSGEVRIDAETGRVTGDAN